MLVQFGLEFSTTVWLSSVHFCNVSKYCNGNGNPGNPRCTFWPNSSNKTPTTSCTFYNYSEIVA